MKRVISTTLVAALALGLLACESKQVEQSFELLPEIVANDLKIDQLEIPQEILEPGQAPTYYVSKAEGTYIYSKPNAEALKLQTLYAGDSFVGQKVNDEWLRLTLTLNIGNDYSFVVGYAKLQDLSTKWQDTPLNNTLMNQVSHISYNEDEQAVWVEDGRRFFELDGYAHIELIDKETYDAAARARVDQFVVDTATYRKQNGKIVLKSKLGPYTLADQGDSEMPDDSFLENTYLGRTAADGAYIIYSNDYDVAIYRLFSPETGKFQLESTAMVGYPFLSPKGDYIVSAGSSDDFANIIILKANANNEYEMHSELFFPFWQPYESYHDPENLEGEYLEPTAADFLPDGSQFWSSDNYFYLRVRPTGFRYKDPLEADPRSYYARIKILPAKASKPSVAKS